ncbi:uncharacterized protein LOC128744771 [Sabethes cyaneus]|uniref:uncharacterized protein LOC128744771 n=1 Tax=Sabethes cyaneus TaxID=53552 RepID=UPI00237DCB90|nr:uncharacterized protein LOC128744771 [Sabethes cyaneus]
MFYKPQSSESQEHGDKKNVFQTVLSGLQSILDPKRIFQQLDSIPGLVQSMLSSFRLKKAEAIQSVREKMDALSVGLESKIREKFTGENGCVEKLKKCSNAAQRAIQPYQKALHQKVESCIGRIARLVNGHDNEIMNMLQKSNDFLSEFNECKQRPDAFSISFLVEFGKCTAKMFKDRTERALKPLLERFGNLGEQLKSRITTNNGCFDRVLQSKALETLQQQLSATNVKCLL